MSFQKVNITSAILFMAIGLVSGFITNMFTASWSLDPLLSSFIGFGVFFGILVVMGIAKFSFGYLMVFSIIGYISSWISSFLGDMWGFAGSIYGSAIGMVVFFVILSLLGSQKTGVQTASAPG